MEHNSQTKTKPFRTEGPRILLLLALGAFFLYRWWTLGGTFHAVAAASYILLGATGTFGVLLNRPVPLLGSVLNEKRQALAVNIGISLLFLDLVFGKIDWKAMLGALSQANYWMLLPAFALVIVSLFLRTWRWQWLLRPVGRVSFGPAFRATSIGIGANMILPARAGEFLRAYVLGRATGYSKTAVFATLVVERILDGLTIVLILVTVVLAVGLSAPELQRIGIIGGAFYLLALGAMLLFYFRQEWFAGIVRRLLPAAWTARALGLLDAFSHGLNVLRDRGQLVMVCLQSLLIWLVLGWSFYPVMLAFDFGAPVPLFAPFLLLPLLAIGLTIPGAPGGIGITQYMAVLALQLSFEAVGADLSPDFLEQAAAFSVLMHLSQAVPEIAFGAWAFVAEGLSWGEIGKPEMAG